jgi:hypothetical protein
VPRSAAAGAIAVSAALLVVSATTAVANARRARRPRSPSYASQDEASALEQLLDVERLVSVLARHAYGGHATSWRSAPFCCALRYR